MTRPVPRGLVDNKWTTRCDQTLTTGRWSVLFLRPAGRAIYVARHGSALWRASQKTGLCVVGPGWEREKGESGYQIISLRRKGARFFRNPDCTASHTFRQQGVEPWQARSVLRRLVCYVEEVPSAQQPIAGVGTNTVAFIWRLVPRGRNLLAQSRNPDYDPVLVTKLALR